MSETLCEILLDNLSTTLTLWNAHSTWNANRTPSWKTEIPREFQFPVKFYWITCELRKPVRSAHSVHLEWNQNSLMERGPPSAECEISRVCQFRVVKFRWITDVCGVWSAHCALFQWVIVHTSTFCPWGSWCTRRRSATVERSRNLSSISTRSVSLDPNPVTQWQTWERILRDASEWVSRV